MSFIRRTIPLLAATLLFGMQATAQTAVSGKTFPGEFANTRAGRSAPLKRGKGSKMPI
jgi:hypothetical protein